MKLVLISVCQDTYVKSKITFHLPQYIYNISYSILHIRTTVRRKTPVTSPVLSLSVGRGAAQLSHFGAQSVVVDVGVNDVAW